MSAYCGIPTAEEFCKLLLKFGVVPTDCSTSTTWPK